MANINCNGKIKTQSIDIDTTFTALNNIGGGFQISDTTNVGIELGRHDGQSCTPYVDFHTDGGISDYNCRVIANGSKLQINANDGVTINNKQVLTSNSALYSTYTAMNTNHPNNSGKPLMVYVETTSNPNSNSLKVYLNGTEVVSLGAASSYAASLSGCLIVAPGQYFSFTAKQGARAYAYTIG